MSLAIDKLFEQEKALSAQMRQFVADASHELRTPLTAINGFLDLMHRGELSPHEQKKAIAQLRAQAQRMARLVNQLLTLSRMDSGNEETVHPVPLALAQWLSDLAPTVHSLVGARPLDVILEPVLVMTDPDRLTEVLLNLLDNVARYTPENAAVTLRVYSDPPWGVLEVEDHGPGIPETDLPHVFDRFYRGDRARSSRSGGSGLGLAIVQAIVTAQGGRVSVENLAPPQHGARFRVCCPLAAARASLGHKA
jgi:two-component system OmpR family sensor kinase